MNLIEDGFLDGCSVEELAAKLGIGPRHLSRLFAKYAAASPTQVAATVRVQRAKKLIDNSDFALAEIAFLSGFGSVRRFNDVFRALYGRPPSSLRRKTAGMTAAQ